CELGKRRLLVTGLQGQFANHALNINCDHCVYRFGGSHLSSNGECLILVAEGEICRRQPTKVDAKMSLLAKFLPFRANILPPAPCGFAIAREFQEPGEVAFDLTRNPKVTACGEVRPLQGLSQRCNGISIATFTQPLNYLDIKHTLPRTLHRLMRPQQRSGGLQISLALVNVSFVG